MPHINHYRRSGDLLAVALAIALIIALAIALSTTTAPATARTFDFNSAGSMTQQPLPAHWACDLQRATSDRSHKVQCK
jgi:hypothetical protein